MDTQFTATHHALLFAWLSRAVVQAVGRPHGEPVVRRAVRRYGEQRGRRMALRALAHGEPLTMDSFLAYGEWQAGDGEQVYDTLQTAPELVLHVLHCPWHQAWQEHGLVPYGRLYCLEIDQALVRGFHPGLQLDVNGVLSSGAPRCEFVYHRVADADVGHGRQVMPWEYHLGHLFKTASEVAVAELGPAGEQAALQALADLARFLGDEAAQRVAAYKDTDFDRLPD